MIFNASNVKIKSAHCCDHCGKILSHNDVKNNQNGASGWMWWFCGNCLYLVLKLKRREK